MRDKLKEYAAVEEAAMKFVRSVAEGDSTYAKELFTTDAVLFGMLDGVLEHGSIDQFYHNVDTVGAGDNFKARVDVLPLPWSAFSKKVGAAESTSLTSCFCSNSTVNGSALRKHTIKTPTQSRNDRQHRRSHRARRRQHPRLREVTPSQYFIPASGLCLPDAGFCFWYYAD